jgi:hypothetical protein
LLKIEDANYAIGSRKLAPLYCLAISSKRYVLFNLDEQGQPIIRKASAHGLGHLMAPYGSEEAPSSILAPAVPLSEIGVERWQYDLWFQIIRAVLGGHPEQVDLTQHTALQLPAMSRYAVTTPALERWFKKHNTNRPYEDRVKPFNFMCGFQAASLAATGEETFVVDDGSKSPRKPKQRPLRPIAPYSRTSQKASAHAFDREEQFFLGMDEDAAIEYGADPNAAALFADLMVIIGRFGKQELASRIGVSRNSLTKILDMKCQNLSPRISQKIGSAITSLNSCSLDDENHNSNLLVLARVKVAEIGLSEFAQRLQVDASNLSKIMDGKRRFRWQLAAKFERYFEGR